MEIFYFRTFAFTIFIVLIKLNCYSEGFITNDFSKRNIVDSIPNEYRKIVSGLNLSYVRNYTELKRTGGNLAQRGWPEIDSIFKRDSTQYWESYQDFFNQDRRFLDWLFTFRNDYNNPRRVGFTIPPSQTIRICNPEEYTTYGFNVVQRNNTEYKFK